MERKIVKLRVDMYNDTKFKIIDTMEHRDLIHYIWTRLLTLAGKVNLEGKLYLSRSIPYTIETLALEFNRSVKKVELALKVFMDLEMIELGENNVYKVRNFAKHQNIKPKKKEDSNDKKDSNVNIESINVRDNINKKDNIEIQNKDILDKINLNKASATENFLNNKSDVKNKIELKDKSDLDAEFVFSKANDNKKRSKPKIKNKKVSKKNDNEIISSWDDEADDIKICEFTDEPPKGKLIATFKV
ncbi:phage protein [Clostridium botulinum]|uniref:phage replisome organizer N-terminal domain-containing protein n=1 Tax=Clostridium botulinum TaxID=1491 RepID=UPI000174E182|nr:phage replisome organizer N-terminal domain-containing protein [Clostridium botulinum]ACD52758.1 phage protein [Clostridium botulinum E3 str. Alaska E43]AJF30793.1 phage protein [Clostridium botulinum]AJF33856.1 phage protein [Clostridium botulinum]MBY6787979.1 phage replisome organizer N-terminal domain-containing protein [Clostridium botulinum]MBY6815620.1 phage replisome organizer N-terminal domain-containing protein [Clostridium botulinum]